MGELIQFPDKRLAVEPKSANSMPSIRGIGKLARMATIDSNATTPHKDFGLSPSQKQREDFRAAEREAFKRLIFPEDNEDARKIKEGYDIAKDVKYALASSHVGGKTYREMRILVDGYSMDQRIDLLQKSTSADWLKKPSFYKALADSLC